MIALASVCATYNACKNDYDNDGDVLLFNIRSEAARKPRNQNKKLT